MLYIYRGLPLQETFFNTLQIMIRKKQSVELLVDEGWFCEDELRDEHGWSQFIPQ